MKNSLSELDPNFKVPIVEDGLAWHTVDPLAVEGLGWPHESQSFCRLPDRAQENVRDDVWQLSRHSAGTLARFSTDAPQISARWTLRNEGLAMPHMPATGMSGLDLYARNGGEESDQSDDVFQVKWRWAGIGRATEFPTNESVLAQDMNVLEKGVMRQFLLYLPLYNGLSALQLGVPEGSSIRFESRVQKPICFYGSSILQGGCASRPGMAYPAIIGRHLDFATINLGFSGNAHAEKEVASLLSELDAAAFVLDPLPNISSEHVAERMEPFIEILRDARPRAPIILIENISYQNNWIVGANAARTLQSNVALRAVYNRLQAGDEKLYYVAGNQLLGDDGEATVDGVHPTDLGFARMAKTIFPVIEAIIADL